VLVKKVFCEFVCEFVCLEKFFDCGLTPCSRRCRVRSPQRFGKKSRPYGRCGPKVNSAAGGRREDSGDGREVIQDGLLLDLALEFSMCEHAHIAQEQG
jgi:hypothetical protein